MEMDRRFDVSLALPGIVANPILEKIGAGFELQSE
jgi:hypothetical protein